MVCSPYRWSFDIVILLQCLLDNFFLYNLYLVFYALQEMIKYYKLWVIFWNANNCTIFLNLITTSSTSKNNLISDPIENEGWVIEADEFYKIGCKIISGSKPDFCRILDPTDQEFIVRPNLATERYTTLQTDLSNNICGMEVLTMRYRYL